MIIENKQKHIIAVARLMKEKAKLLGLNEEDMFVLGYLHDIGYEFDDINHHNVGGKILQKQGYKYYKEVLNHGLPKCDYSSIELDLLNYCDMHVDPCGNWVTFEDRLEDIKTRYGENSLVYKNAYELAEYLKLKKLFEE